jgi:hypothetical protein
MTLNVLRDEDGNMMSLIKYWNEPTAPIPPNENPGESFLPAVLDVLLLDDEKTARLG